MTEFIVIKTTFSNSLKGKRLAKNLAKFLLEEKLAACIQITATESFYLWNDEKKPKNEAKIENVNEILLTIKTRKSLYKKIETKILENHEYQVPQIISYEISQGYSLYLSWIEDNTKKP